MHASPEMVISHLLNGEHYARPQGERVVCACGHKGNYGHHVGRILVEQLGITLGDTNTTREAITAVSQNLAYLNGPQRAALAAGVRSGDGVQVYQEPEEDLLDFDVPFTYEGASGVRQIRAHSAKDAMAKVPGAVDAIWRSR